jgi:hypothetical protein
MSREISDATLIIGELGHPLGEEIVIKEASTPLKSDDNFVVNEVMGALNYPITCIFVGLSIGK